MPHGNTYAYAAPPRSSITSCPGGAYVNVPGFNGEGYECSQADLDPEQSTRPTGSFCFCQRVRGMQKVKGKCGANHLVGHIDDGAEGFVAGGPAGF